MTWFLPEIDGMLELRMLITTGKVNNGAIQVDSKEIPDGTTVTLLAREGDETFELDDVQERELLAAIEEADRGELMSAAKVLDQIRRS